MNRRQQERVADLGRAFQEALTDVINMGDEAGMEPVNLYEEECATQEEPRPMLAVDLNDKIAQWDVNIKHVHNGFVVSVGCQTFVFETFDKMAKYMAIYYNDPQGTYEKHYSGKLFK